MRTQRAALILSTSTLLALAITGCAHQPMHDPGPPPGPCERGHEGAGIIEIDFDVTPPRPVPDQCHVKQGKPVVWIAKGRRPQQFTIKFPGDTPDSSGETRFPSGAVGRGSPNATIPVTRPFAPGRPNRYDYEIRIGNQSIDPSIIIDQ